MLSTKPQASEEQRREALRNARQRIVELHAVRTYLQESGSSAAKLSDIEALLTKALQLEQALIADTRKPPRPSRARVSRVVAGLLVLASWADDGAFGLLELAPGFSFLT